MATATSYALFLLGSLAVASNAAGQDELSGQSHVHPHKGAAMFQASMSMQTQPTKAASLSSIKDAEKNPLQGLIELVVKLVSPTAGTMTTAHALSSFILYFMLTFTVAFIYRKCKANSTYLRSAAELESSGFAYGLVNFEKFYGRDLMMFALSFCFIGVRWADTMDKSRLASFWVALSIFTVCSGLSYYTTGFTTVVLMCFVVYCRQALRKKYNMEHGSVKTCLADIAVWWICFPLAAVQEARQVEYVQPVKEMKAQ